MGDGCKRDLIPGREPVTRQLDELTNLKVLPSGAADIEESLIRIWPEARAAHAVLERLGRIREVTKQLAVGIELNDRPRIALEEPETVVAFVVREADGKADKALGDDGQRDRELIEDNPIEVVNSDRKNGYSGASCRSLAEGIDADVTGR